MRKGPLGPFFNDLLAALPVVPMAPGVCNDRRVGNEIGSKDDSANDGNDVSFSIMLACFFSQ